MSTTPRTDAMMAAQHKEFGIDDVPGDFARGLERENVALSQKLAEAKSELESVQRRIAHVCAAID